ncbi:Uncharacterised protein [Capnocytophaga ochracea]|uniref:Lipoprotein n=2 Tax=Capnocytophaga ochracea TaxID=1018 RepID=A0A7Z8YE74_CAPOC|nr:Uncharacterised protein [Capnocytophaga ochracea]
MLIDNSKAMKKILIFTILLSLFLSCDNGKDCMNVPPSLCIIIVNNAVNDNRELLKSFENTESSAFLYKLIDNKKVKISYSPMANKNIKISNGGKKLKEFYTGKLETFYLEYDKKTDTLQVKGDYYDSTGCGDNAYLSELYFNHKKIELNLISAHTYLIDNTK